MASPDHVTQLDQTLDALGDEPTALSPQAAAGTIDRWLNTISDVGRDDLNNVASALGELRELLLTPPLDGGAIAGVLDRLARHTTEAAAMSDDDLQPRLERLADRLARFARILRPSAPFADTPDTEATVQVHSNVEPGSSSPQFHGNQPKPPTGEPHRRAQRGEGA